MTEKKASEKKTEAADESAGTVVHSPREKKKTSRWTLELCRKRASRYQSLEAWRDGSPSSYKAAVSHGWEKQCCSHMTARPEKKTTRAPMKKSA